MADRRPILTDGVAGRSVASRLVVACSASYPTGWNTTPSGRPCTAGAARSRGRSGTCRRRQREGGGRGENFVPACRHDGCTRGADKKGGQSRVIFMEQKMGPQKAPHHPLPIPGTLYSPTVRALHPLPRGDRSREVILRNSVGRVLTSLKFYAQRCTKKRNRAARLHA